MRKQIIAMQQSKFVPWVQIVTKSHDVFVLFEVYVHLKYLFFEIIGEFRFK